MRKYIIPVLILAASYGASAQKIWPKQKIIGPAPVCIASDKVERTFVPPPAEFLLKSGTEKTAEIEVNYSLFPDDAKAAFEYAVSIWETIVESPIQINIQANWRTKDENVLGSCGPEEYKSFEGSPHENCLYPIALVEKLTKKEISGPETPDMTATFNKNADWYFGIDGNCPDSLYDFASVVLHEIGHGLGFTGFFFITDDNEGAYGYQNYGDATPFDVMVVKNSGEQLTDSQTYINPSTELKGALTSGVLYSSSPVATLSGRGFQPRLYSPNSWNSGSSIYHLNDATYPGGNPNSLMTHATGKAEVIHDPGPITMGIMADMGWKHLYINFEPLKDIEETKPLAINLEIESDFEIDSTSLFVCFSTDSFRTHIDSVPLLPTEQLNQFSANYSPLNDAKEIDYYITAGDKKNRTFTQPVAAPKNVYQIKVGPDTEKPDVTHEPIPYFLLDDEQLKISASIDDNIGVDTVYITYKLNNVEQPSFGLALDSATIYSGRFNFELSQLNDGDIISYNIVAKDASVKQNTNVFPLRGEFSFRVEKVYDPITGYYSSFDNQTSDFIISDFTIETVSNFENPALHSPHPYLSPDEDDVYWNYSTILKHPIILSSNATMSFDEVVLVEPGETSASYGDDTFWDFVVIEGSKDGGQNWLELANGYDSGDKSTWRNSYNSGIADQEQDSKTSGSSDLFINREIDMIANQNFAAGDTILVRFRLHSDPFAHGWGWAIDNLRIQQPVSAPLTTLSPGNISVYPNPFKNELTISVRSKEYVDQIVLEIFNMFGQKIRTIQNKNVLGEVKETVDLSNISTGVYFMSVRENGKLVYSKRIIKN